MRLLFYLAGFLLPSILAAQEVIMDPVTVVAGLSEQKVSVTGRNIMIIKGEAFHNMPVSSIDELLRYVPGIEVQARGAMGSQSDIVIRGGTFQQVLIILDGSRLNDPITGHFNSYIPVSPTEIDRIEILKGAASAIYGSEAVGGVIHIITKSFGRKKRDENKTYNYSAMASLGSYNLSKFIFGGNYLAKNTAIGGGLMRNKADGQMQRGTRGYFNNITGSVSLNQRISDEIDISIRTAIDDRSFAAQNFYTTFLSDTARESVKTYWNQARISFAKDRQRVSLDAGYKVSYDDYSFNASAIANRNQSKLLQLLALFTNEYSSGLSFTTGGQFQNRMIRSNDRGDHEIKQAAAFVVLNRQVGNLNLSPAIRVDWDERAGTELIPQINLSYSIKALQLRASAGKTTRAADFTERFNNYKKSFVSSGRIGNPALEAERSFSYEAGGDYFFNGRTAHFAKFSLSIFQRRHEKLIDWVNTAYSDMPRKDNLSPTGNYALAKNIAYVRTTGIETDVFYSKHITGGQKLSASLGITWLESEGTQKSFYILSHANLLGNFSLHYASQRFTIGLNGLYKNREPQSSPGINATVSGEYFIMNARLEAFVFKNKAGVFLQADNLFDKKYQDLLGSQMPGRWFIGGVRWRAGR